MESSVESFRNPLESWGSVLAVRDLRLRVHEAMQASKDAPQGQEELLAIDPLTVLRCMRVAHSPVYDLSEELLTIPELCKALGNSIIRRALDTPPCDIAGTGPLRSLWLHSIATAHAARSLAIASGECDPEKAYVLGLLHDLPLWLHYLSLRRGGLGTTPGTSHWVEQWHLPRSLHIVIEQTMLGDSSGPSAKTPEASVVAAAELLAELADFWHPDDGDSLTRRMLHGIVTQDDLRAARELREEVTETLGKFGLDAAADEPLDIEAIGDESPKLFRNQSRGNVAELVLSLLGCNDSNHYRGIITATTSACLRYLGFERAYYVQWSGEQQRCYLRAKSDLSPRPLKPTAICCSTRESEALDRAQANGKAQHIVAESRASEGLLRWLGSDEVLVVPLNRDFKLPTFLVLDRALSGTPIRLSKDRVGAEAMAGTASLLTENLLLRKQRTRAQKYSLTDPLTRLFNRSVGISSLDQEIARAQRTGAPLTVLMLDLDDFKALNDSRGHLTGDQALRSTADVLRKTVRKMDIVCRYGGEEFLVVLPDTSLEEASILATRIFTAVHDCGSRLELPLTISIGLAAVRPEDSVESVLMRADRGLYASKARGRNRFSVDEG